MTNQNSLTIWGAEVPTPTPELTKSLSPQQLAEHRAKIASEVKIVLGVYFQPNEDTRTKAGQLAWWCDVLEDWTHEQVVYGFRQWNLANPEKRPTPGSIVKLLKQIRGERMAERRKDQPPPQAAEEQRETVTADRAAEILKEFGMTRDRLDVVTRGESDGV